MLRKDSLIEACIVHVHKHFRCFAVLAVLMATFRILSIPGAFLFPTFLAWSNSSFVIEDDLLFFTVDLILEMLLGNSVSIISLSLSG